MRSPSVLIGCPLLVVLLSPSATTAADTSNDHASPSIAAQSDDAANLHLPAGQPSVGASRNLPGRQPAESTTLEVAPQPSVKVPAPDKQETAEQRAFRQSREDEIARLNRNFHPHDPDDHHHRPYLGIDLEYTTQCYLGVEEHGFEVVNVYPNSPAARAGVVARTGSTPAGDLGALGSVLLFPVAPIVFPLLRKSGALGTGGDLIIAVDDVRVRSPEEIRSRARPSQAGRYDLHHGGPAAPWRIPSHDADRDSRRSRNRRGREHSTATCNLAESGTFGGD